MSQVHAVVARRTFQVKMCKSPHVRATFGRPDVVRMSKKFTPLWLQHMNTTWICTILSIAVQIFTQKFVEHVNFQLSRFSRCVHAHLGFFHADFTFFHGNIFGHDHPNLAETSVLVHIWTKWTNCFATFCCQHQGSTLCTACDVRSRPSRPSTCRCKS